MFCILLERHIIIKFSYSFVEVNCKPTFVLLENLCIWVERLGWLLKYKLSSISIYNKNRLRSYFSLYKFFIFKNKNSLYWKGNSSHLCRKQICFQKELNHVFISLFHIKIFICYFLSLVLSSLVSSKNNFNKGKNCLNLAIKSVFESCNTFFWTINPWNFSWFYISLHFWTTKVTLFIYHFSICTKKCFKIVRDFYLNSLSFVCSLLLGDRDWRFLIYFISKSTWNINHSVHLVCIKPVSCSKS